MTRGWQTVRILHKDGQTTHGICTGANIWWHCVCGWRLPMLATPGDKPLTTACPECKRRFQLPARGTGGDTAEVKEI